MHQLVTEVVLPLFLFLLMAGMGLTLTLDDFRRVVRHPRAAIVCLGSMLLLLPGLGFAIAALSGASGVLAVGLVMVATTPGGIFSNVMTHLGRGNLALSIGLTSIGSLVYVFTVPLWVSLGVRTFLGESTDLSLPFGQTLLPLVLFVLLPVVVGMVVRARKPALAERIEGRLKTISSTLILVIFVYLAYAQSDTIGDDAAAIWMPVVVLNLLSVALAAFVAMVSRLPREDAIAVVIEHSIRQEGTAIYVATTLLGQPQTALPLMINSGVGMVIAIGFLSLFGGRAPLIHRLRAARS